MKETKFSIWTNTKLFNITYFPLSKLKETYSLIKTAIKELPETITQLKSSYDLVNQYNTEINKGDEE